MTLGMVLPSSFHSPLVQPVSARTLSCWLVRTPRESSQLNIVNDKMSKKTSYKTMQHKEQHQWVLLAPDSALEIQMARDGQEPAFVKLCHPKTGNGKQFLLSSDKKKVCELLKFYEEPRSWFIEDSVQRDGSLFIATPIDPLFLILPYLTKFSQKFRTLDQILLDEKFPSVSQLSSCVGSDEMIAICDRKGDDDLQVFRINNDKVFSWLKWKVECTADKLSCTDVHVRRGAQSATFIRSKRHAEATRDDYIRYAFGLTSDYLNDSWSDKLKQELNISEESTSPTSEEPPHKRTKTNTGSTEALEDYSKEFDKLRNSKQESDKTTAKLTAAQKSLSKVDKKGMKSISSFFGAGAKKGAKK